MSTASDFRQDMRSSNGKSATIVVTANRLEQTPWVAFSMAAHFPNGGGKQDGKEKLKFDDREGPFDLDFKLDDNSGRKLEFMATCEELMWVAAGTACPQSPGNGAGAIAWVDVDKKRLNVVNSNAVAQTLSFALIFKGLPAPDNQATYPYDPIIINGGGSRIVND